MPEQPDQFGRYFTGRDRLGIWPKAEPTPRGEPLPKLTPPPRLSPRPHPLRQVLDWLFPPGPEPDDPPASLDHWR